MIRLKSECFKLVSAILIATLLEACSPGNSKESEENASTIVDTLNYEKKDYDSMRLYFNADTLFLSTLKKGTELGDTKSVKMKKLLTTEYESRDETGMTESEIDAVILSYYTLKKVTERFKGIESRLPKTGADALRLKTDSLIKSIEKLKKKLKEQ